MRTCVICGKKAKNPHDISLEIDAFFDTVCDSCYKALEKNHNHIKIGCDNGVKTDWFISKDECDKAQD